MVSIVSVMSAYSVECGFISLIILIRVMWAFIFYLLLFRALYIYISLPSERTVPAVPLDDSCS